MINKNKKIEKQKIVSLEDFLSNSSSSTLLSENSNKNDKVFMGIGDWGLGIGDWGLGPFPNPQSPIPNPQSPK